MVSDGQGLMVHPIADYQALIRRGIPIASTAALIMPPVLVHRYTSDRAHQPLACAPYTQCSYRTPGLAKPLLCQSFSLSSEYEWQSKCSRRRMIKLSGKRDSSSKVGLIAWSCLGKVQGISGMGVRHAAATGEEGLLKNAGSQPDGSTPCALFSEGYLMGVKIKRWNIACAEQMWTLRRHKIIT